MALAACGKCGGGRYHCAATNYSHHLHFSLKHEQQHEDTQFYPGSQWQKRENESGGGEQLDAVCQSECAVTLH